MEGEKKIVTLSSKDRFAVLGSWNSIEPKISEKGFGAFEGLKSSIGASVGPILKEDVEAVVLEKKQEQVDWPSVNFLAMDPEHEISCLFYKHLFSNNPQMVSLFWRFNLHQSMSKIVSIIGNTEPQELEMQFRALASRHRGRGIKNADYDIIGVSFTEVLSKYLSKSDVRSWENAWNVFTNAMKIPEFDEDGENELVNSQDLLCISMEEVGKHNTRDDAWLVIEGKVYNVSKFIASHPGGDMILEGLGKNATSLFTSMHSKFARKKLPSMLIGRLEEID